MEESVTELKHDEKFCSSCGKPIKKEAEICPNCGVRQKTSPQNLKSPGLAAILSVLITGLGQIYNGQIGKGIGLIVLQCINVVLIFALIGLLTFPITWVYGVYDAYKTAESINQETV
jgi:TM2 domain-containing membrane protein YozV